MWQRQKVVNDLETPDDACSTPASWALKDGPAYCNCKRNQELTKRACRPAVEVCRHFTRMPCCGLGAYGGRVRGDLFNHQGEDRDIRIKSISRVRGFWRKVRAALHLTGGSYGEKSN